MESLYHTYVCNHDGLTGTSFVEGNEALAIGVSSSLIKKPGANPEQFIGFALATCFNATIRIVQHRLHLTENSKVQVRVDITKDEIGYQFIVNVEIKMPDCPTDRAQEVIDQALLECPVAKLVKDEPNVHFQLVDHFTHD